MVEKRGDDGRERGDRKKRERMGERRKGECGRELEEKGGEKMG